ncbi:MAG: hypothetical protein M3075_15820 [Candidatus Dormibacteraeota bacterium]|nr:hypothetical protein [Candidatus Dormibacteraeota bacterium]
MTEPTRIPEDLPEEFRPIEPGEQQPPPRRPSDETARRLLDPASTHFERPPLPR